MRIQFEEKTFDEYFNSELALRGNFFFPPGQVQEGSVGIDSLAMSHSRWLWRRLGYPFWLQTPKSGTRYREIAEEMEKFLGKEIKNIPDIKGNILFQFKRSEYMVLDTAAEWPHWNGPYYRYDIYPEQQLLLAHLHVVFSNEVLVLYAAPAVQDVGQLVDLFVARQLISTTNFRPAHELTPHRRNTFISSGTHSWGCSEPVRLEPFDFDAAILSFKLATTVSNQETIVRIGERVHTSLTGSTYAAQYRTLAEHYGIASISDLPILNALSIMKCFRELTGIRWVSVLDASSNR